MTSRSLGKIVCVLLAACTCAFAQFGGGGTGGTGGLQAVEHTHRDRRVTAMELRLGAPWEGPRE